ncbi:MAG: ABC transporter substrate-binding protein [Nitrospinota bacterium]
MKRWTGWVLGILGAALWLFSLASPVSAEKVIYCASWSIYGQHAPIVAALQRGTFKAHGLDVTHLRGYGSGDTFKRIGTGACNYGDAGAGPSAIGRTKGIKAKQIAMVMAKFQETLYFFADSGIKTPKDIEGRRITGGPKASSDILMWPVLAKAQGIDTSKVQILYMTSGAKAASLGKGQVDVVIDFHSQLPRYLNLANQSGKKLVVQLWEDFGIDLYANGLIASDETIAKRKDLTRRFLRGYFEAQRWAFRNRKASVDLFLKKYPEQNRAGALQAQDLFFFHFFDKFTDKFGLGYMDREKMANSINLTLQARGIKTKLDPSELYTNEFVNGLPKELRFFHKM